MSDKDKQLDKIKKQKILEKKNKIKYCNLVHFGKSIVPTGYKYTL